MKNSTLSTGLNIVLVIAVAILFYLHFASPSSRSVVAGETKAVPTGNFKIAYFETDSIQNHFEYFKDIAGELDAKNAANQKALGEMKGAFANKYQELQKVGASLTQAEQQARQQELTNIENAYRGKEKMMSDEMQDLSFRKMQDVKMKIEAYLKEYNKDKGYAFIFRNVEDMIYYKDSAYNITQDVVNGLNRLYPKKK